jgi:hypothetical protein
MRLVRAARLASLFKAEDAEFTVGRRSVKPRRRARTRHPTAAAITNERNNAAECRICLG